MSLARTAIPMDQRRISHPRNGAVTRHVHIRGQALFAIYANNQFQIDFLGCPRSDQIFPQVPGLEIQCLGMRSELVARVVLTASRRLGVSNFFLEDYSQ